MADLLHFSLVSPVRELFSGDVKQVDAPGVEGEFGVLPKHAPFMTVLKPGVVRIPLWRPESPVGPEAQRYPGLAAVARHAGQPGI